MKKNEVPLAGKPVMRFTWAAICIAWYILLLVFEPDTRPGFIEAAIGMITGSAVGLLLARALTSYLTDLTSEFGRKKWLGWASLFVYPLPFRSSATYRFALAGALLGCFVLVVMILEVVARVMPNLGWPWVHSKLTESILPALLSSFVTLYVTISVAAVRWYGRLPD